MTEHPAWMPVGVGHERVFRLSDGSRYQVTAAPQRLAQQPMGMCPTEPTRDVFWVCEADLAACPELVSALASVGEVSRYRAASLWEAISWAVLRARTVDPERVYRKLCWDYGEHVTLRGGVHYALFPTAEALLDLTIRQFLLTGLDKHVRRPLVGAAEACIDCGNSWSDLPADSLMCALELLPRIGQTTARLATADWSNDWSVYPHSNELLHSYARRAAPAYPWPGSTQDFARVWRDLAEGDTLSRLTVLTLAWGSAADAA